LPRVMRHDEQAVGAGPEPAANARWRTSARRKREHHHGDNGKPGAAVSRPAFAGRERLREGHRSREGRSGPGVGQPGLTTTRRTPAGKPALRWLS